MVKLQMSRHLARQGQGFRDSTTTRIGGTRIGRRLLLVVWPFAILTVCIVLLAAFSMELLSAARAYVGGEGLWSKAQKEAAYSLVRYADSRNEADYRAYLAAIAVPLGDRKAREELQKPHPDPAVARAGFIEGRNHEEDIPGMSRLFRWFGDIGFMARAIAIWTEGDRLIAQLDAAAHALHDEVRNGGDSVRIAAALDDIDRINKRLAPLEDAFSYTLGEASRTTRALMTVVTGLASAMLLLVAVLLTRRILRQRAASEEALRTSEERYSLAVEGSHHGLWDWDIRTDQVYYSPRLVELLGFQPGEIAMSPNDYVARVHPEDIGHALGALDAHLEHDAPYDVDYRLRMKSGEYRWFHARGKTVRDADGRPTRMAGSINDITERKRAEDGLRDGENQLRSILQALPFPFLIARVADRAIIYRNDSATRQFKAAPIETKPAALGGIFCDDADQDAILEALRRDGEVRMHEVQMRDAEGHPFWALVAAQLVNVAGAQSVLIGLHDITERKARDDDIRRLAFRDTLTTLPNRAAFDHDVEIALSNARSMGKRLAILFLDLDQFKHVNDTFGHKAGDRLLQAVATRLASCVRQSDSAARLGGDEFVVLLPDIHDFESVAGVAWKLLDRVAKPLIIDDQECAVTASIGISCYPEDGGDLHALLKNADIAMYRAKAEGKNTFRFFSSARDDTIDGYGRLVSPSLKLPDSTP